MTAPARAIAAAIRASFIPFIIPPRLSLSVPWQRKRPHGSAERHERKPRAAGSAVETAQTGQHGHILPSLVRPGNRLRVDAGACLEFPQRLAGVRVHGEELASRLAVE